MNRRSAKVLETPATPPAPLAIEWWPVDRPVPYAKNARTCPARAVDSVAASLKEFGWRQPIVVDEKDVVVAGHKRLLAAKKLGYAHVPVHIAVGLTAAQVKAYRLMDNRSNQNSEWDMELLQAEMLELQGSNLAELSGFQAAEVEKFLKDLVTDGDAVPEVKAPRAKSGDLWLLGEHRVLCGDSMKAEDVARLLGDRQPLLMVTDPPYGIELDMEWRDRAGHNAMAPANKSYMKLAMGGKGISGDTKADWSPAFANVPSLTVAYVWHATSKMVDVAVGLEGIGFEIRQQIIWVKTVAAMSRQAYHWKHEPCWYAVKKGHKANWLGGFAQTTVWEAASPKHIMSGSKEEKLPHPTQKPVALMTKPIENHTKRGELVYEPFLGSGTTLAAAELTGRVCVGIEIDPKYVDVVIARWETMSGKKATLEAPSGKTPTAKKRAA